MTRIPDQYLAGLTGSARSKRAQEIQRERTAGTFEPLPSDIGVKTKRSRWAVLFQRIYGRSPRDISDLSKMTGVSVKILQEVYNRGLAAWSTGGHRRGATQHGWAMARALSFVLQGPTAYGPDRILAEKAGIVP